MPHRFTTFTAKNTMKATIMNVISATKKSPTANGPAVYVDRFDIPGIANPIAGNRRSFTNA
jgi:hypothetical protein